MTPDQQHQHDMRLALEHAKEVLRVHRWNLLTSQQRHELTEAIKPGLSEKEIFRAFERVREIGSEAAILLFCTVGMGGLWIASFLWR